MAAVGRVESVWRYPVKSMRGEQLPEAFIGFGGVRGDRVYAIHNARAPEDFPYFTAREQGSMLLCRPTYTNANETGVGIETPGGANFAVSDPSLLQFLTADLADRFELTLMRSDKPLTDSSPVSLISTQTATRLSEELGSAVDKRRFRANVYLDLADGRSFGEDEFLGLRLKIGPDVLLAVVERDVRCKMITLDPDTSEPNPELMKLVAGAHERCAGVYANVLQEGIIRPGDQVEVVD